MSNLDQYRGKNFRGRNARLLKEWESIEARCENDPEILPVVRKRNPDGLPVVYEVVYNIRSFCGVEEADENGLQRPIFSDRFQMRISIPNNYPSADSKLEFKFLVKNVLGQDIPHPWHPNIRYFGDFAGRVCLNADACGTFTDLSWYIDRVAHYLRYETYHAKVGVPPFPEDEIVAKWVTDQGEPQGWVDQLQQSFQKNENKK